MSREKEAALTGVLYYLLEEEQEVREADAVNSARPGIPAWALSSRTLCSGMLRMIQSRKFCPPAGCRINEGGMQSRVSGFQGIQKSVEHRIRLNGHRAASRNLSNQNKWDSGS